jgi:hydroxymethylbilane synthase
VLERLTGLYPNLDFRVVQITTIGDRRKTTPIDRIPSYGVFVKELEEALLDGRVDLAVHSLKDLSLQIPDGLAIGAIMERDDPGDALVSWGHKLSELAANSVIGTGSPRRTAQLRVYRPDLRVKKIRGNIDTRLRLVDNGEVDGIIVAAAGLIRLGWEKKITEYLPVEHFLPQPGQGALVIEVRASDLEIRELVQPLHHQPTAQAVNAERAFLALRPWEQ